MVQILKVYLLKTFWVINMINYYDSYMVQASSRFYFCVEFPYFLFPQLSKTPSLSGSEIPLLQQTFDKGTTSSLIQTNKIQCQPLFKTKTSTDYKQLMIYGILNIDSVLINDINET